MALPRKNLGGLGGLGVRNFNHRWTQILGQQRIKETKDESQSGKREIGNWDTDCTDFYGFLTQSRNRSFNHGWTRILNNKIKKQRLLDTNLHEFFNNQGTKGTDDGWALLRFDLFDWRMVGRE